MGRNGFVEPCVVFLNRLLLTIINVVAKGTKSMFIVADGNIVFVTVVSICLNEMLIFFMFTRNAIVFRWRRGILSGVVHYFFFEMNYLILVISSNRRFRSD